MEKAQGLLKTPDVTEGPFCSFCWYKFGRVELHGVPFCVEAARSRHVCDKCGAIGHLGIVCAQAHAFHHQLQQQRHQAPVFPPLPPS